MQPPPFPSDGFAGVVRVAGETWCFGFADRAHEIPNAPDTQFGIASGTKGFTRLVAEATLAPDLRARELLGDDLPLIDDRVTVAQLLDHTSGIGDYYDEDVHTELEGYVTPNVHELDTTEAYLRVLDGFPQLFEPGTRTKYCNGGYVVLALLAERATGASFFDLVDEHVCEPAGLRDTAFLRSDALPGRAALGYLADGRTNVFHLPVRGSGDGGLYTTLDDLDRFWARFDSLERLQGGDAGVSMRSLRGRYTVLSNTTSGAWPVVRALDA
ncbi:MAG: serine hydrolase domain-containing protein [Actinomycetota bacterium]